ncbi:MAG: hypothetical protein WC050_03360 [Candidatus Paceibacterota bacterium]
MLSVLYVLLAVMLIYGWPAILVGAGLGIVTSMMKARISTMKKVIMGPIALIGPVVYTLFISTAVATWDQVVVAAVMDGALLYAFFGLGRLLGVPLRSVRAHQAG